VSAGDQSAGAASVEHVGLCFLLVVAIALALGALAGNPADDSARELGSTIAERIACAPRHPIPCHRNPLALAYGFPLGKLVRLLAPRPRPVSGPGGVGLLPVDFRYCRRPSCALPGADPGLTASNRRATAFTSVQDRRRNGGGIEVSYWLYRPGLGWELRRRLAGEQELAAAQGLRLNLEHDPALVPLELLAGRNHYDFPAAEEPPWRWLVESP
jgi:hypothetical protein